MLQMRENLSVPTHHVALAAVAAEEQRLSTPGADVSLLLRGRAWRHSMRTRTGMRA